LEGKNLRGAQTLEQHQADDGEIAKSTEGAPEPGDLFSRQRYDCPAGFLQAEAHYHPPVWATVPQRRSDFIGAAEQVARFWRTFRTFRDLAIVGLMLLDGLRSAEVLSLQLEDLQLAEAQMRVLGKGSRQRVLPLPPEMIDVLGNYLRLERPLTNASSLFVSLKGRHRGRPMTAAGLRALFRHHRGGSCVPTANAHRFRHTFGADMVRAGIALPALQHLMGHAHIHTTMLYVQLAPQDVWREYARAVQKRACLSTTPIP
jgi:integrase